MGVLISFPKYGKKQENPSNGERLENYSSRKFYKNPSYVEKLGNWCSQFSHSISGFLPLSSHSMVYFIICKMRGFLHQFPTAWENTAKSIKLIEPGKLVPIFSPKYGYFSSMRFPSYGIIYHMVNPWLSYQFLTTRKNAAKSTLWTLKLFFRSIIVSACSKICWFLKRTDRKNW